MGDDAYVKKAYYLILTFAGFFAKLFTTIPKYGQNTQNKSLLRNHYHK